MVQKEIDKGKILFDDKVKALMIKIMIEKLQEEYLDNMYPKNDGTLLYFLQKRCNTKKIHVVS